MKIEQGEKIKVKVTIVLELSSAEYENTETIIDEFSQETDYDFKSTPNVTVHNSEFRDCKII